MRLYIIRHGDPDYENDCLTPSGLVEAKALAKYLAYVKIDKLYCSPLGRARKTADIVSEKVKRKAIVLEWLRELPYRPLKDSGLPAWDLPGNRLRNQSYLKNLTKWGQIPEMKESKLEPLIRSMQKNSDQFLSKLGYQRKKEEYRILQRSEDQIAVVCHAGMGLAWLSHLLAIPLPLMWAGFFLHTTSVSTILFDERKPGIACPRCLELGGIPHLYHHRLPPSKKGIIKNYY